MAEVVEMSCCCCGVNKQQKDYYKSYSALYLNGYMPICKTCFNQLYEQYKSEYQSSKKAMQRLCMAFDVYWHEDDFDRCDKNDDKVVGRYLKTLNLAHHQGKTFDDSLEEGFAFSGDRKIVNQTRVAMIDEYGNVVDSVKGVSQASLDRWGFGFDPQDYAVLDQHYKLLKTANPNLNPNQEIFVTELCYMHMQSMKSMRENDIETYNKLRKSYRESFKQAGLHAEADTESAEGTAYGELIGMISKYTPEEYYKNKDVYKDWDGKDEYYRRNVIRPEQNIENGTAFRDPEHSIPDFDDGDVDDGEEVEVYDEDEDYS